jgi:hypothetical protein
MTDLTQLRAALADDERTPAGIDVAAIRTRARRTRRRAVVAASVAVVAVLAAIAVPVGLLGADRRPVPAAAAVGDAELRCSQAPPQDRNGSPVPSFQARQLLVCDYRFVVPASLDQSTGRIRPALGGATVVVDREAVTAAQRQLRVNANQARGRPCTQQLSPPVTVGFAAADGRTASITTQKTGCGYISAEGPANLASTPAAASCPAIASTPGGAPAGIMMPVPRDGLLLCRYEGGPDDRDPPLAAAALLTGQSATALVEQANALSVGVPSCPNFGRSSQVAIIALGPGGGFPMAVANLLCPTLSNGTRNAGLGGLGPELDRLTR